MVPKEKRFALKEILEGNTDFFICLPPALLASQPQVPRTMLGALATCFLNNLKRVEHDTLFVVDEMPRLGRMEILSTSRDIARKYALYVWAIVQDLGQLEEAYKKTGVRSWLASPAVLQFFGVSDLETAEMLSRRFGDYTAVQESESNSRGKTTTSGSGSSSNTTSKNVQGTKVALISPDEIMSLAVDKDGVPEEQLLMLRGRRPLRCGLPKYFRRKEMAGLVKDNPYYRPPKKKLRSISSQQAVAAVYGAVLALVATITAASPLPLMAGDEAVVAGEQAAPVFWTNGAAAGALAPGWRVRVVSPSWRDDGYVEVLTAGGDGVPVRVLVYGEMLVRK
jgi:type IV secretion system protein VirD4